MPKSKNRKDHAKKVAARNQKINQITNMKKKQVTAWLQQLQAQAQAQTSQPNSENIIDISQAPAENIPVVEEVDTNTVIGESGQL